MKEYMLGFSPSEIEQLFKAMDVSRDGSISYDEFLREIRGPMNQVRINLVKKAFEKLDKDGSGVVDINDIKGVYNATKHPDVKSGKKTEDEVLMEFLETFETHHNVLSGKARDSSVTWDEFIEYYNNISASIDNDEYFQLMMNNAWQLDGHGATNGGWSNQASGRYGSPFRPKSGQTHEFAAPL
jgi:Ca2+-binding EF-hand superfamily protein